MKRIASTVASLFLFVVFAGNLYATYPPVPGNATHLAVCDSGCRNSAEFWMWAEGGKLYIRVAPQTGNVFLCSLATFTVVQNNLQYSELRIEDELGDESFCDKVFTPSTFWIACYTGDPCFNANQSLTLIYDGAVAYEFDIIPRMVQAPQPESGWWWNSNEDGRGYNIEIQGNKFFMSWYGYDAQSGEPCWLASGGTMIDSTHYSGQLVKYSNGQCFGCPYVSPDAPEVMGNMSIVFTDQTHGHLTSTYGPINVNLERFLFGN